MKTAISIPNPVFKAAERLAHQLKLSRSELYVTALKNYLENYRKGRITGRLDMIYSEIHSQIDPVLNDLQARSLPKDEW